MRLEATDHTTKGLLIGTIRPVGIMTHTTLLGGIGALDFCCLYASFGSVPGDLLRNVCKVGGVQVGVHGSGLVLHRGNRKLFIGDLVALMLGKALIDRAVDLLAHMPDEALPA